MMSETMSKIEESLKCSVCNRIPRDVPVPCCEVGHIICQTCRKRFMKCQTCRKRLKSNTNSIAESQVMFIFHKCKFSSFGCEVKMKLEDIFDHEKVCSERTIKCPYYFCKKEIQLKKFKKHAAENGCVRNIVRSPMIIIERWRTDIFSGNNIAWKFEPILYGDLVFYFDKFYMASINSYVFRVFLADDVETASKYTAMISWVSQKSCL